MAITKFDSLDDAIRSCYLDFDTPVDAIVSDPAVAEQFTKLVNSGLSAKAAVADVNKRLLSLRKRGESNGGLVRLRREFNGRTSKPTQPR